MVWFLVCFATITLPLLGFSWSSVCLHVIFTGISFCVTYFFLTKEWELDFVFDFVFKLLELFGFGTPHRLDSHLPCSSLYASGGYNSLQEIPKPLEESLKKLLNNIIRDFICSWYSDVGEEESFTDDTRRAMEKLCVEGYVRASQIDSHYLLEQVIVVFHGHLDRFNKAMQVVKAKDQKLRLNISSSQLLYQTYQSQLPRTSPSLSNPTGDLSYLRSIIDSSLAAVMPKDTFGCDTGRFILREILAVKVLHPLVSLLTDPDWINQAVLDILKQNLKTVEPSLTDHSPMGSFSDYSREKPSLLRSDCSTTVGSISSEPGSVTAGLEQLDGKPRAESKDLGEKEGEKIRTTTTEQGMLESVDFQWAITSQRQPPSGESEHESESFLVISVDENQSGKIVVENATESANNWSLEVVPSSSVEDHVPSSLSSSWGIFPSPNDQSFQTQSYQNMTGNLTHSAKNTTLGAKIGEFGHSIKEMTCCHIFEESGDAGKGSSQAKGTAGDLTVDDSSGQGVTTRFRTRSLSYPGQLSSDDESGIVEEVGIPSALIRSVSVPCRLPTAVFCDREIRNQAADPFSVFYGSTFYSTSCRSSLDSFKSVSSEDDRMNIEQGTDVIYMADSCNSLNDSSMSLTSCSVDTSLTKLTTRKQAITKQDSFEENEQNHKTQRGELDLGSICASDHGSDICGSLHLQTTKEASPVDVSNESSQEKAICAKDSIPKMSSSLASVKLVSEVSFGDAFISAGKKLVSNFKPPFKFESGSSNSTKSTDTSTTSGDNCMDQSTLNDRCPLTGDHMDQRQLKPDLIHSLKHGQFRQRRLLSRSDAVVQESLESDLETCYSTPGSDPHIGDEIAYSRATVAVESLPADVIRIHPSELISIPSTVVALETTWEPGRNKYTLYKIQYDIRIWREVYSRTVKEAKKERLKQKSYASITSQPRGDDISLETIKREIPLKRIINRRYREFMELHSRLTSGILGVHMKDILKPNRKYNLPFGRLDPHVVEGRRRLLQYYLVSLVSKPPLRNSEELKQFMGVTGGEHVSFVKPSVAQIVSQSVHVPRVDKMLSRQMTKVIDSIKTAFDSVEEAELASEELSTTSGDKGFVPWKLECDQGSIKTDVETDDGNACLLQDHYYAFLGACEDCWPATPPSIWRPPSREQDLVDGLDEVAGRPLLAKRKERKQMPCDTDEDGSDDESCRIRQSLGPRTAGDGSDNPEEFTSCASHNSLVEVGIPRSVGASQMHVSAHLRERSGEYLESLQSDILTERLSHSVPPSGSESKERVVSQVQTTARNTFPFGAHKILEAAKRFGHGAKSGLNLNASSEDENPFRKLARECSPGGSAKILPFGSKVVHSPEAVKLKPEEPSAMSAMDHPSDIDDDSRGIPTQSDLQCPLLHSLLNVSLELFHEHRSWITLDRVQQAIVATFGGLLEWYLQRGIDDITSDECWAYYLDQLNDAIWPGGQLQENKVKQRTEEEKIKGKKEAIYAIMDAVPGLLKMLIGTGACFKSVVNVVESLQHPQVNKILLFALLELLLSELIPEIQDDLQFLKYICSHH